MTTTARPVAAAPGAGERGGPRVPTILAAAGSVAVATLVLALVLAGGSPEPAPAGLPDSGPVPAWGLRVSRLALDLAGVLTVGCLLTGGVLLRAGAGGALGPMAVRAVRSAGWWAVAWVATAGMSFVLTASDLVGLPLSGLTTASLRTAGGTPQGRALILAALLAVAVAAGARYVLTVAGAVVLLAVALAALLPVGAAGHASSTPDHDVAVNALAVHVGAAAVWVGGLAGLLLIARSAPDHLTGAARRFSPVALVAYVALAGSGLLVATTRLGTSLEAWTSGYGALVAAKAGALALLGVAGLWHRRRTLPGLASGGAGAFLRLAAGELLLMAVATGLAAALSRTPVPPLPLPAEPAHGGGHSTLPSVIDPISLGQLATAWRINAVLVLALGLALAAYLTGVRSLVRRGKSWPVRKSIAFTAGILLGLVTTCSGLATYAPAMVSMQLAQTLLALLPVPALLALGAPLTLWLEVRGPREGEDGAGGPPLLRSRTVRLLSDPFTGAAVSCALLLGLYRSSLIEASLSSSWVHVLVLLAAMVAGLLLLWPVLGVDPAPGVRSRLESALCVAGVAVCLGLLAVQLRGGDQLLAAVWFLELRWGWVDPVADQRVAGTVAGAAAAALVVVAAVPLLRPARTPTGSSVGSAPAR